MGYYTILTGPNAGKLSYEVGSIELPKNPLNAYVFFRNDSCKKFKLKLKSSEDQAKIFKMW